MRPALSTSTALFAYRFLLLFVLGCTLFAAGGCHSASPATRSGQSPSLAERTLGDNDSKDSLENLKTYRGLFTYGHEVRSLALCGSDTEFRVNDRTVGQLKEASERFTDEPYRPFFIEIIGRQESSPEDGFAGEYSGTIAALELVHASSAQEGWGCREKYGEFIYKVLGNEPGWMALITPETVTITSAQHQEPLIFRYSTMTLPDGGTRYEGASEENAFTLTLERGQCLDTMSGEQFGWTAEAVINGMVYHGCAKKGDL